MIPMELPQASDSNPTLSASLTDVFGEAQGGYTNIFGGPITA
jgi:hypothetical protein